jgi:16S rRNA (cytosine1407-C5)-methyltransferase
MSRGSKPRGSGAFDDRYRALFGARWDGLAAALAGPSDRLALDAGGAEPYWLDSASIFAARALELPREGAILDACAAPGGKSLAIASGMGSGARLVSNELSADRRRRLREVLDRHLGGEARSRVEVRGRDAASLCRSMPGAFDAILLDAPCSSERHVLADPAALAEWTAARVRALALRQWALLSSALIMLKPGGCLVYSTCALSPEENDGVVARAAARYGAALRFERPEYPGQGESEPTEYGVSVLPDRCAGAGPMYVSRMRKLGPPAALILDGRVPQSRSLAAQVQGAGDPERREYGEGRQDGRVEARE